VAEEFGEQEKFAMMLSRHLDPKTTAFWTCWSAGRAAGCLVYFSGEEAFAPAIPDVMVVFCGRLIFIELKSQCGVTSSAELLQAGAASWWMARSARCDDGAGQGRRGLPT
jgi:hypothetical protein